jgi:TldD protein
MKALDAAKSAGATYVDVRLTRTMLEEIVIPNVAGLRGTPSTDEINQYHALGVRALVNGYWGFAATPYWTVDEAVRVAGAAVAQAKVNAQGPARSVEWSRIPVVTGSWCTPIQLDPFRLSVEEKRDLLWSRLMTARRLIPQFTQNGEGLLIAGGDAALTRQEVALATSEGSYVTQTFYRSRGTYSLGALGPLGTRRASATGLDEAGEGWEMFAEDRIFEQIPGLLAYLDKPSVPKKAVEIGRKPIVCDANTMAQLLNATLGRATEVDRALGYEANASGTSYLGPDPLTFLGTPVANELVTITANRSLPTGLATVQWDADSVRPENFTLVKAGTLVDYQTTREQAQWLAPWYSKVGMPVRSHGCAGAENALSFPMQRTPNLALEPAATGGSFEELVAGLDDGIVVEGGMVQTDYQSKNGLIATGSHIYQVKNGKRIADLQNAGILFNAMELWKSVTALGGTASVQHWACNEVKGEPQQETKHTVSAPPGAFKELPIIDIVRKA